MSYRRHLKLPSDWKVWKGNLSNNLATVSVSQDSQGNRVYEVAPLDHSANLRDVGNIAKDLRSSAVFRSSQQMSSSEMQQLGIQSILDLRFMARSCRKVEEELVKRYESEVHEQHPEMHKHGRHAPLKELKEVFTNAPTVCSICSERFSKEHGVEAKVYHADLIPTKAKLCIFCKMPRHIKLATIQAVCKGQCPESVMAPAVADPQCMGYAAFYQLLLQRSKPQLAKALRVFVQPENFPLLVHCIHGKDRTGLVVMLVLLLCDIDPEIVVLDYVQSEISLKASREKHELKLEGYLTTDDVIASTADCMTETIHFLESKWGSAKKYAKHIGLKDDEISKIRVNVLNKACPTDLLERMTSRERASLPPVAEVHPTAAAHASGAASAKQPPGATASTAEQPAEIHASAAEQPGAVHPVSPSERFAAVGAAVSAATAVGTASVTSRLSRDQAKAAVGAAAAVQRS
ncbi:hypothetical protein WJX72_009362 [[Myrmecia] bisecta]|uniref:Tyrosine specific protein phosphatases domain-containing protein n=1 Tax=[Myrmecia] bisecta TaxID=41462 RepID=A0AAW1PMC0_9CHLO